jgi:DNA-binding GntR family transcriptional regulator
MTHHNKVRSVSRSNSVYKETYNLGLDLVGKLGVAANLPPETELAQTWNTSRTTVRAVLEQLDRAGIIKWNGRRKSVLRAPSDGEYYGADETQSTGKKVETAFMEYILGGDLAPGTILRESELVREFGASTSAVREYLIRFSRFGLIRKEPNRHWVLVGFTREFAMELFDVREMFETRAFRRFMANKRSPATADLLETLEADHVRLIENIDREFLKFPRLDERFHSVFVTRLENRFIDDFFELVSMIFHFHYRWKKTDERDRNLAAAKEHLAVIRAIKSGRRSEAEQAFARHLQSARRTLLNSVTWD